MPYRQTIKSSAFRSQLAYGGSTDSFWAIQENVGYGYKNHRLDVMLVQFFLNRAAGSKILKEDGFFGGKTWRAIKDYQTKYNSVSDGMVSAAQGQELYSKKQGKILTICSLNIDYYIRHTAYYDDLKMDPELPSALCNHFTVDFDFDQN